MFVNLPRLGIALALFLAINTSFAAPRSLPQILRDGLRNNPDILEAQANEAASYAVLDRTKALKYPTVTANAAQPMASSSGYNFNPTLNAQWTIYDFGKTNAQIAADEIETKYQYHIVDETRDKWAYDLSNYYLNAVMAKLQLAAAKDNLARHKHIVEQTRIITQYDPGRRSEFTQAESRLINVEETIVNFERNLDLNLRRIARYISPAVSVDEISDPFKDLSSEELMRRYPISLERLNQNPSYLAQEQVLRKNEANLTVAEKDIFPRVNLEAQANKDDAALYLTVSVDVFNKGKSPTVREQEFLIESARAKLDQMSDSLKEEAELAVIEMRRAESQLAILDRQIRQLQQVVSDYEDQFKISARTLLNVVDAYSELNSAKQSKASTEYNLMAAKLSYLNAAGAIGAWANLPQVQHQGTGGFNTIEVTVSVDEDESTASTKANSSNTVNFQLEEPAKQNPAAKKKSTAKQATKPANTNFILETSSRNANFQPNTSPNLSNPQANQVLKINKNGDWELVEEKSAQVKISPPKK